MVLHTIDLQGLAAWSKEFDARVGDTLRVEFYYYWQHQVCSNNTVIYLNDAMVAQGADSSKYIVK
jgi:hypothetical protein